MPLLAKDRANDTACSHVFATEDQLIFKEAYVPVNIQNAAYFPKTNASTGAAIMNTTTINAASRTQALKEIAASCGWVVRTPDESPFRIEIRSGGNRIIGKAVGVGTFEAEVSFVETYSPQGVNALNMEVVNASRVVRARRFEWNGKKRFNRAEFFDAIGEYISANHKVG